MSREHPKKEQARKLFVEHDYSGKAISELLSISEKTISLWRSRENWEEEKAMNSTTPESLIRYLFSQINMIKDNAVDEESGKPRPLTPTEVNSLATMASSIQKIRGNVSPQIVMQVLNGYNVYLEKVNLDLAKANTDYISEYYNNYKSEKV